MSLLLLVYGLALPNEAVVRFSRIGVTGTPVRFRAAGLLFGLIGLAAALAAPTALPGQEAIAQQQKRIALVSARDHIEGAFLTQQSIHADRSRIYLSAANGKVFVLARDRGANFPLLETVVTNSNDPFGRNITGDREFLYVGSFDGVHIYRKTVPLSFVTTVPMGGVFGLALRGKELYVVTGFSRLSVDKRHVHFAQFGPFDRAFAISLRTLTIAREFTPTSFDPTVTSVFDRRTGTQVATITNPTTELGDPVVPQLYVDKKILALISAGPVSGGARLHDPKDLSFIRSITRSTNAVARDGRWFMAGSEGGLVDLYDLQSPPMSPELPVQTVNLRVLTGHTEREAIEIRALWADGVDDLVFAASSWGNDQIRGPLLPSFFVLELVR